MVNDPVGDLLIQIKNASMAGKRSLELPHSRLKMEVAQILAKEGYIGAVSKKGQEPKHMMHIELKYEGDAPAITDVKRVSKPGLRQYVSKRTIPTVVGGMGIAVLSTPQGVMSGKEARKRGIGGELLCTVW